MNSPESRYDLWSVEARNNPLPLYKRMRQEAPIARLMEPTHQLPMWVTTRYKDSVELLRDPRFTKDERKLPEPARSRQRQLESMQQLTRHMLASDPPDHTRLRALVSKAFTPRRVEGLRPRILALTDALLDAVQAQGSAELLEAFAIPLPITVIAELLGIPPEEREQFRKWSATILAPPENGDFENIRRASMQFVGYLQGLLAKRRAEPGEDLISALLSVEEQGDQLTPVELLSMMFLLLVAGHETTVNLIGNGVWALFQHPEQLERLRKDPGLIDSAVEEMLRFCGPVETTTFRWAVEDTAFHGHVIPAGETVIASLMAADHDPEQFPDPERFDITRDPNRHIAFGSGMHFCLGAPLARLEGTIALNRLLERLPQLRLGVDPSALRWHDGILMRGLQQLPVAF